MDPSFVTFDTVVFVHYVLFLADFRDDFIHLAFFGFLHLLRDHGFGLVLFHHRFGDLLSGFILDLNHVNFDRPGAQRSKPPQGPEALGKLRRNAHSDHGNILVLLSLRVGLDPRRCVGTGKSILL